MKVKKIGEAQGKEQIEISEIPVERTIKKIDEVIQTLSNKEANKTKFYVIGGILLLVIIALLYYIFIYQKTNDTISSDKLQKENIITTKKIEITKEEINDFVNRWSSYQSNKQISDYIGTYDLSFSGIKRTKTGKTYYLNYSEWIADRSNMYSKAKYVTVTCSNINAKILSESTAEVSFNQLYISDSYNDEGVKILKLKKNSDGKILITNEELIYSASIGD